MSVVSENISRPRHEHGAAWYLAVLTLEAVTLGGVAILIRYLVQRRSRLNDADTVRHVWSMVPDILHQPVARPLIFAIAVALGAQDVMSELAAAVFPILWFSDVLTLVFILIANCVVTGMSALIAVSVYRMSGGTNWKACALTCTVFTWWFTMVEISVSHSVLRLPFLVVLGLFQVPFYLRAAYQKLPPTSPPVHNAFVGPVLCRTSFEFAFPLVLVRTCLLYFSWIQSANTYLCEVVRSCALVVLLSSCALAAMVSVRRVLLARVFKWQWHAFLTPTVPLAAYECVLGLVSFLFGNVSEQSLMRSMSGGVYNILGYGTSGVLGGLIYIKLVEKSRRGFAE